ncbi:hypothetical protein DNX69_10965 [Rhodopseudomonas palustris]|uniref:Com family DNA-binding transcriptional regulator n=1 Tax=Rhodopseudomonas palustris TaxID=1076 RepID=A0A323UN30_RHOPL|nr:hypothetical protein DNX69_10965 [Rhodopseudomonas palustris]
METIRCARCRALLFRAAGGAIAAPVEIKCRRCGSINILRPTEPPSERRERRDERSHAHVEAKAPPSAGARPLRTALD